MSDFQLTRTLDEHAAETALRADVLHGLTVSPKVLPPKWFYDAKGSELFEEITRLPEYYPTRAEREILLARAGEIASASGARTLVELGSGSSEKTRHLIEAMPALDTYIPVDVSGSALEGAAETLLAEHPGLRVHALVADFTKPLQLPPSPGPRLVVFLGGTIGNLLPPERAAFLASVRAMLSPGDALLVGTDLVKDEAVLVAAYDDAQGVTAEFNKNVLAVVNRELGADFHTDDFAHVAVWNREHEWIEMRLRARSELVVKVRALDLVVPFAAGEEILTEVSAKFRQEGVRKELAEAGLELTQWWTDAEGRFALSLAVADGGAGWAGTPASSEEAGTEPEASAA
ncbi:MULTISPECIES: L-histidine N(alpha)-methyltransferase [unclassified Streptomyces]|uniref:L-histidine N(alpha)-methyltransferase n=1 Tax=unclassified Streptomyces TaxID=2593676 RepID=UPI00061F1665|nr:L-histidine N(alpha)-methyltransferase [Streptomyces sp. XY332]KJY47731.1 histidyl-tRNA synthetase [Streptomyces sp. NRRL S-444]KOY54575.1 histidyl-tRNA synthetase [Streptomyces sp. XY332]TDU74776.1 L-histidine N-alpha-methyltransferase [Streptomyces sp. KS 21]THA33528.1 L-histidine N(alpha)-methyltransferase [Streptomyces sp. A1547]